MPRHRLVLEARCACWVPGNPRFTRAESLGRRRVPRRTRTGGAAKRPIAAARGVGERGGNMVVQVMQGLSSDPDRARELMANDPADWQEFRPDILGTVSVGHDGNAWTMAIYFTSEESAREGEQKEPPPQMQEMMKEMDTLTIGEPVFFDLRDPWLHAPG